ncbi:zonular occludens toxin family protein [Acinetobacter sp. 1294596]|uniref:zonular occludens toxin domain-containing protein n=1 Tax=Acinetobacter sp. 1294596 TaxID=1310603 RepID=UPI00044F472D|nr:zonular occludens toxin domain-containing protein [Acinetobacter sp. 1294596]EXF55951.1 zonular occludens toxin family protein [Acinetobacter sp. 1294596]
MLYLISAPPRTGKTLKAIEIIFKHLNQGRVVYTNIVGIKIPGVMTFSSDMQNPHDWRDLPNDSVVIYDEAHEHPAFADRNLISDKPRMAQIRDIGISLTLHGHFGFDIYMITQNPRLLCAEVLASVGTHYIMRRKFGYDMAMIFEYAEAKTTFSKHTASDALVKTFWRYPKHLYKFYVSSEVHNIKKTFPLKYYAFLLIPLFLFYKGFANAQETSFFGLFGDDKQVEQKQPEQKNFDHSVQQQKNALDIENQSPFNTELPSDPFVRETKRIASVFLSGTKCTAYSGDGNYIDIPFTYCKELANNPRLLQAASNEVREQRLQAINYQQQIQQPVEPTGL